MVMKTTASMPTEMLSLVMADCPFISTVMVLRSTFCTVSIIGILKWRPVSTIFIIFPNRRTAAFSHCLTMNAEEANNGSAIAIEPRITVLIRKSNIFYTSSHLSRTIFSWNR
ncbi:hypothetical protein ES703_11128 [subsurface metagenome]